MPIDATSYLYGLVNYERTPAEIATSRYLNLDRMRAALERDGNPHLALRCVHIAGTKGKGSTAAMLAAILRAAGRRVGLFSKPHLITLRERIRVDDELISEDAFAAQVEEIIPLVEGMRGSSTGMPTFFEALTLIALRWFVREGVDLAVLETGMGGRLDSTNVVTPLVTAITTIALDHTAELGHTPALIAAEKAGIIKPGVPVISAPQVPEAAEVIARVAQEHGCSLYRVGKEICVVPSSFYSTLGQRFTVQGRRNTYVDLTCPLLGEHQQLNAAVAIGLAECLQEMGEPITPAAIRAGMSRVEWPGRLQVLSERPLVILDGAHNPASIDALLAALDRHFPGYPRRYVVGFSREKDWPQMLRQLAPTAAELVLTAADDTPRAAPPAVLARTAEGLGVTITTAPDIPEAMRLTLAHAGPEEMICVTGSLHAVGNALAWWTQLNAECGIGPGTGTASFPAIDLPPA